MGILDNYKRQLEEDRLKEDADFDMPSFDDDIADKLSANVDKEAVAKRVKELRNDPNDMEVQYKKFQEQYPKIHEETFTDNDKLKTEKVTVSVIRAYCPNCGKEIVSKFPIMFNPYTGEKIGRYDCECGFKANLDYAYPRVAYFNENGEEIKAFNV
mgnify:CR=1 FL=1